MVHISRATIEEVARAHNEWVDNWGLQTGKPGPLDDLIWELEKYYEDLIGLAKHLKEQTETGDD